MGKCQLSDQDLQEFLQQDDENLDLLVHIQHCESCEQKLDRIADVDPKFTGRLRGINNVDQKTGDLGNTEGIDISSDSRFEQLGEIARGGMGVIVRATDKVLKRTVALKTIKSNSRPSVETTARFIQEARICGMLQHPGVVPVHDLGLSSENRPFLVMKLIDGKTLATLIADKTSVATLLDVFAQICQTLAYSHSKNVVHRDLKPQNIMVGAFGEVQVMDWGLAKILRSNHEYIPEFSNGELDDSSVMSSAETRKTEYAAASLGSNWLTRAGVIIGTPCYMPPEQALGQIDKLDKRADVFALGAILCEILTGKPPCGNLQDDQILAFARKPDYSKLDARLEQSGQDVKLIQLVKKCIAPEIEDRPCDASLVSNSMVEWRNSSQARLREVEIEFAKSELNASNEKKRRIWATAFALALAALAITVALSAIYAFQQNARDTQLDQQREAAIRANENAISRHLNDVSSKRSMAIASNSMNPETWNDVLHSVELAKNLVNEDTSKNLRQLVNNLQSEVSQQISVARSNKAEKVRLEQTLRQLEQAHTSFADYSISNDGDTTRYKAVGHFESAFSTFGIMPESSIENAKVLFDQAPLSVKESLVFGLYEWCRAFRRYNDHQGSYADWLKNLSENLDFDSNRMRLRKILDSESEFDELIFEELPEITEVGMLLACETLGRKGKGDVRRELLISAVSRFPDSFWANLYLADDYATRQPKMFESALSHYFVCAAINPECLLPQIQIGSIFISQKEYERALDQFERLAEKAPNIAPIRTNLGTMYMAHRKYDKALEELKKSAELRPDLPETFVNIGEIYFQLGDGKEAELAYQKAMELDPNLADPYVSMARVKMKRGDLAAAMQDIDTALELQPNDTSSLSFKAIICAKEGELEEAKKLFERAIELSPQDIGHYLNLSQTLLKMKKMDDALAILKIAENKDPINFQIFVRYSRVYKMMGDKEKADAAAKRGRELHDAKIRSR